MESVAKRKAGTAAAPEIDVRPSKRQRLPGDTESPTENVETTTATGLRFVESLRAAKDKTGRPIATHFLTLPDKSKYPEYYEHIKLPIAIDTIEGKLQRGEYSTLAQVESDCKRLVNNAKSYNDKKSLIYEDAERVRKTASNFMVKHNPAYRTGNYVAVATPIPGEEPHGPGKPIPRVNSTPKTPTTPTPAPDSTERPRRAAASTQPTTPAPSKLRQQVNASNKKERPWSSDFAGLGFQQAQEKLVEGLIKYVDPESELQIFQPFVNLPSRSLRDYYQVIKRPTSLQGVMKKVQGVVGRNPPTGITDLKSWDALENEMSWIWRNAREYNEDGSDIYNLSLEFEELFKQKLADAKAQVEEPPQPKLKLNMAAPKQQSLKIRLGHRTSPALGSDPNTPASRSSATPGVIIDNEALQRQQRHIQESINGARGSPGVSQTSGTSRNPFIGSKSSDVSPPANGIKNDPQNMQTPTLNSIRPASTSESLSQRASVPMGTPNGAMPPPSSTSRPTSGSPHPNGINASQANAQVPQQTPVYHQPPVVPHFENFRKSPLKNLNDALIPKITVSTHPALQLKAPYSVTFPADIKKSIYSVTLHLPASHSYLQVTPYLPIAFTPRLYRAFVQVNGIKAMEVNRLPPQTGLNGVTPGFEVRKKGEPVYEAKLNVGVNRIEVEVVAEKDGKDRVKDKTAAAAGGGATVNGKSTGDNKDVVDVEKCTIYVHLMRT